MAISPTQTARTAIFFALPLAGGCCEAIDRLIDEPDLAAIRIQIERAGIQCDF
jgi:hypothetical protein